MAVEVKVPSVGESVYEVTIGEWLKSEGDWVDLDEPVVALETDKASVEVPAPRAGKLARLLKKPGESANIGEAIGIIDESAAPAPKPAAAPAPAPAAAAAPAGGHVMPAARRVLEERGIPSSAVQPTGPGGRILKEDALRAAEAKAPPAPRAAPAKAPAPPRVAGAREEEVVPMTPLRRRIAERLVESQQTAALLTTFNEVDMSAVIALRNEYKDSFQQKHGIKLGFMSFFVKAAIEALKAFPAVNAEIRGTDIVYKNYYDIGVAVGGGRGLVVPVIRSAEALSFADVEKTIADFGERARANKLAPEELQGGTFTISNGGVYGSLMSTPIVNPPQVGILGMHAIQERPVARDGQVVIRPMMNVALTYDHRIIDGRESVSFLKRIKECVEAPSRILLEV
ncbi:MAG: 2-oxoglutarate dehydrogenase complex dihydrolipoyllysine-residue succinyltransferase [Planctomycetes bacterium]|nr:2-oxoglutarate dehydrogenase complex dihydrolipoyllysine-residue succinyltransferase [Planctomycetota bacterium]